MHRHTAVHLLVGVFVSFQRLHDRQLGVVFESGRLVPQNFFQHPQRQSSDGVLWETKSLGDAKDL